MLGFIGFSVLAVVVATYAYTSSHHYMTTVPMRFLQPFVMGFTLLAAAAAVWAATFFVSTDLVQVLVFVSNGLLLAATGCMLGVLFDITRPWLFLILTLLGSGVLAVRAFLLPSAAYIADGLLFFNLSQTVSTVIGLIFLVVWLPAIIKIISMVTRGPELSMYRAPVLFMFMATVLMTSFFLSAQRPIMIIVTFVSIVLLFTMLLLVNLLFVRIERPVKKNGGHRGQSK